LGHINYPLIFPKLFHILKHQNQLQKEEEKRKEN